MLNYIKYIISCVIITSNQVFSNLDGIPLTNPTVESDFDDDFHFLYRPDSDFGSDSESDFTNERNKNNGDASTSKQFSEFIPKPPVSSYFGKACQILF